MYRRFSIVTAVAIGIATLPSMAYAENISPAGTTDEPMESCNPLLDDDYDLPSATLMLMTPTFRLALSAEEISKTRASDRLAQIRRTAGRHVGGVRRPASCMRLPLNPISRSYQHRPAFHRESLRSGLSACIRVDEVAGSRSRTVPSEDPSALFPSPVPGSRV